MKYVPDSVGSQRFLKVQTTAVATVFAFAAMGAPALRVDVAVAASKRPAGSVKLTGSSQKSVGSVRCGKIRGSWLPGTKLAGGYFIAHHQQEKNYRTLIRKTKGSAKKNATKQASSFAIKAKAQLSACRAKPTPTPVPAPTPSPPALPRIDLSGAVGLAIKGTAGASSRAKAAAGASNLEVVMADGQVRSAVTSGTAQVSNFLVSPTGKIYLVGQFSTATGSCTLAELPLEGGEVTCLDSVSVNWPAPGAQSQSPPVQFDASGAIYYLGSDRDTGKSILRRNAGNGDIRDLVTDNVSLRDFLVQPDGTVFLTGDTISTNASWLRKISPSGGLQTLFAGSRTNSSIMEWIRKFPDGNVYVSQMNAGFMRYLTGPGAMDPLPWLANSGGDAHFRAGLDCGSGCAFPSGPFRTTVSGKVYNIASGAQLTQYFPVVSRVPVAGLSTAMILQSAMNHLIVAGLNSTGQNVLLLYDTSDDSVRQLIGPDNEIEIYHLNYSSSSGKILFDGLRFADNKFVLGEVDVTTGEVRAAATLAAKWQDFQTFR
jgi:hypothetical protein